MAEPWEEYGPAPSAVMPWEEFGAPPEPQTEGFETVTPTEQKAMEFQAEKAFPSPRPAGFFRSLAKSFGHPFAATGRGPGVFTLSDEDLQSHLEQAFQKASETPSSTGMGVIGELIGGTLGSVANWAATARLGGMPAAAAAFGSAGAYDAFLRAGMKALSEGKSIEEASAIGKTAASGGGIVGAATALALPTVPAGTLTQAAKQGIIPSIASGAGTVAQNIFEKTLGLKTPVMEGAAENAAMMGVLPPAAHMIGAGLRRIVAPPVPPPIPAAAPRPALPVRPAVQPEAEAPVAAPAPAPAKAAPGGMAPKYYDFGPRGPVEILEINREKKTALVRPLFEPEAPTEVLNLRQIISRPARGGEIDAIQRKTEKLLRPVPVQPGEGAREVPVAEAGQGAAPGGPEVAAKVGEQPARAEAKTELGDVKRELGEEVIDIRPQTLGGTTRWTVQFRTPRTATGTTQADIVVPEGSTKEFIRSRIQQKLAEFAPETERKMPETEEARALRSGVLFFKKFRKTPDTPEIVAEREKLIRERLSDPDTDISELERAAIDAGENAGLPIRTIEEQLPEGSPFAGEIATRLPSGEVVLNRSEFQKWIKGIKPQNRVEAIESLINEEKIHTAVPDAEALSYWNSLTAAEKALVRRRYTGRWGQMERFSDTQMGHEAVRGRLQQLSRMTPREVAEAGGMARFGMQTIYALEKIIHALRRAFGTKASEDQIRILEKMMSNLTSLKAQVQEVPAGAYLKEKDAAEEVGWNFDGPWDMGIPGDPIRLQFTKRNVPETDPTYGFTFYLDAGATKEEIQARAKAKEAEILAAEKAAAYRKPKPEEMQELPLVAAPVGAPAERPTGTEMGLPPVEPITPQKIQADLLAHLNTERAPSFEEFSKQAQEKYGARLQPGQLREAWRDSIWDALMKMPGAKLTELVSALKLKSEGLRRTAGAAAVSDVIGRQKIPDAPAEPVAVQPETGQQLLFPKKVSPTPPAKQSLRNRAIALIGEKLMQGAEIIPKDLKRKAIEVDDIRWFQERLSAQPSYRPITTEEQASPDLANILAGPGSNSHVSGQKESVTKRVVSLLDTDTRRVHLVSVYQTGRGVTFIVDPKRSKMERPHVQLDVLRQQKGKEGQPLYRFLDSYLLDEPVERFHQRFESRAEYREDLQGPSKSEQTALEQGTPVETREVLAGAEPEAEERPSALRTGAPLTDSEAKRLYDFFGADEPIEPADIHAAFEGLISENRPIDWRTGKRKPYSNAELFVIDSVLKLVNAEKAKEKGIPDEIALGRALDTIYENATEKDATRTTFVQALLRQFPQEVPEAGAGAKAKTQPAATELTMRERLAPTMIRGEPLKPGEPAAQPPTEVPERLLPKFTPTQMEEYAAMRPIRGKRIARERAEVQRYHDWLRKMLPTYPPSEGEPVAAYLKPAAKSILENGTEAIKGFSRWYSEWMVERLRRAGGPLVKQAADVFDRVISRERELYGTLTPSLDPARREAGKLGKATTWLHKIDSVTPRTGIANVVSAIEGTAPVPTYAQRLVAMAQQANVEIGQLLQPVIPGFKATGAFQRNLTAWGYDIIREGRGKVWQDWTQGLAVANGLRPSTVRGFFRKWKAILDDPMPDMARLEKINQDFSRVFPEAVTHVRVGEVGPGVWQPVMHADLFNYLENAARRATHVRAFREFYPMDASGRAMFRALQNASRRELNSDYQKDWDSLIRTLHGHPTDSYTDFGILRPGTALGETFRFINSTVGNLASRMVLTGQMFVQPGENIAGSTPVFLGYRNYLRALARIRQLYPQMEQQGMVNRVMHDMTYDPNSPVRSAFRIAGNVLSRAFAETALNELQEAHAATTARVVSERIKAGTLSSWEQRQLPLTFKSMGFTKPQVADLMRGDPDLLAAFERKAASFLTSGNKAIAEGSRLGANRLFNSVFRFQLYPMMKLNQLRKVMGNFGEAMRSGSNSEKVAASEQMARFLFGAAAQGALTVGITALAYEGLMGAGIRLREAMDDTVGFLVESFAATMSGPMYLLYRGSKNKGLSGIGEQSLRTFFPYAIANDMMDAAHGAGQYRNLDAFERAGKFVSQKLPGTRFLRLGMSAAGLSTENVKLDAAIKGFYRWRRDALGFREQEDFLNADTRKQFRIEMKRAVEALKRGDAPEFNLRLRQAAQQARKAGSVTQSLRSSKILKRPDGANLTPQEMDALTNHIGEDAVNMLRYFDGMLDAQADALGPVP